MKKIPLTKGYSALVDKEDYDFLKQWKWHALVCKNGKVYAERCERPTGQKVNHIMMHRLLNRTPNSMDTDHINGNTLDNRRSNLRTASRSQNMWNRNANKKGTSKYKGVYWHIQHRKWCATIQINKKRYHIGLFINEEKAREAYERRAAIEFRNFNKEINYA